jgi:hypothetical protein
MKETHRHPRFALAGTEAALDFEPLVGFVRHLPLFAISVHEYPTFMFVT